MATYAVVSPHDNSVVNVIKLSDDDILDPITGEDCPDKVSCKKDEIYGYECDFKFVKTSFNKNLPGKYASIGDIYMEELGIFVLPKPYDHFVLDEENGVWIPSEPKPERTQYQIDNLIDYMWKEELYQSGKSGWVVFCANYDLFEELEKPLGQDGNPLNGFYEWHPENYIEGDILSGFLFVEFPLPPHSEPNPE